MPTWESWCLLQPLCGYNRDNSGMEHHIISIFFFLGGRDDNLRKKVTVPQLRAMLAVPCTCASAFLSSDCTQSKTRNEAMQRK